MPPKSKITKVVRRKRHGTIDPNMRSYENEPVFIKKAQEAKELIDRVGLPEEFFVKDKDGNWWRRKK